MLSRPGRYRQVAAKVLIIVDDTGRSWLLASTLGISQPDNVSPVGIAYRCCTTNLLVPICFFCLLFHVPLHTQASKPFAIVRDALYIDLLDRGWLAGSWCEQEIHTASHGFECGVVSLI